jgi:hypothetical protein
VLRIWVWAHSNTEHEYRCPNYDYKCLRKHATLFHTRCDSCIHHGSLWLEPSCWILHIVFNVRAHRVAYSEYGKILRLQRNCTNSISRRRQRRHLDAIFMLHYWRNVDTSRINIANKKYDGAKLADLGGTWPSRCMTSLTLGRPGARGFLFRWRKVEMHTKDQHIHIRTCYKILLYVLGNGCAWKTILRLFAKRSPWFIAQPLETVE